MPNPERRRLRGQIAAASRHHPDTDLRPLRRDLAAEKLADYIAEVVAEAPPLTDDQVDRIAGLLRGGGSVA